MDKMDKMDKCVYNIEDISLIHQLGRGSSGEVFLGEMHGKKYVIKKMDKYDDKILRTLKNEITINKMIECKFPNLLCYRGCVDSSNHIYLVFDYIPNVVDMYNKYWKSDDYIDEEHVETLISIMIDMAKAIENIHSIGILHLDIKPENYLVNIKDRDYGSEARSSEARSSEARSPMAYLIDYGYSCIMNEDKLCITKYMIGTLTYMAPEMINIKSSTRKIGTWTDIYSLGMVYYEFLSEDRTSPYEIGLHELSRRDAFDKTVENVKSLKVPHISIGSYYGKFISDHIYNMVMLMIDKDIHKRPTIKQVISILTMRNKDE